MWALRKACTLLRIAVVTIPLVLAACGGGGGGGSGPSQVADPNVVGDTQAAATAAITAAGLTVGTITTQASSTVAAGDIISESPSPGTQVSSGSAVNLIVSSGPAPVSVPNVVGDAQAAATTAITGAGLVVGTVTMQSSTTVAAGNVISESPAAGTSVSNGSGLNLVVSSGPAAVSVPNVVGDTQAAATTAITGAGLAVGSVTMQSSATVAGGNIISESPTAGMSVSSGSTVNLVVSSSSSKGYTVGGNITGLATPSQESSLVLSDGTSTTTGACPGLCTGDPFVFAPLLAGTPYSVSVVTQPAEETCSVTQGATGTIGASNVTNVMVSCLAGTWMTLSTMPFARGNMAVAVLNNLIYAIAGDTNDNSQTPTCYNTVSVYDPSANSWSFAAPYPVTGFGMRAVAINGYIYVFGGTDCNNNNNSVASVYEYDSIANSWTAVSTMPYGGGALTNVGVGTDGTYAYVFGGINAASVSYSQSIQVYEPVAKAWTSPNFTAPPMAGAAVVWVGDGSGGGVFTAIPGYGPSGPLSAGYQYFPDSNAGFSYPVPFATDFPAAAGVGSNIYAVVGATSSSTSQFYQLPKTPLAPPTAQRYGASAAVVNGVFYLIGGIQLSQLGQGTGAVESYQPCTDVNIVSICVGPQ
jgi:beta-lactam-binding protein with PASTA domain